MKGDSDVFQLFKSGEIDVVVPGYKGSTETLQKDGEPVEYALASEGQLTWTCGYSIGANAANVDGAYALINHYAQPETQGWQAENFFYLVSNEATLDAVLGEDRSRKRASRIRAASRTRSRTRCPRTTTHGSRSGGSSRPRSDGRAVLRRIATSS